MGWRFSAFAWMRVSGYPLVFAVGKRFLPIYGGRGVENDVTTGRTPCADGSYTSYYKPCSLSLG